MQRMDELVVPDSIERIVVFTASVDRVWAALTDPVQLVKWFGDGAEVELRPGGRALFSFGEERCPAIIEAVEPMSRFAFWWQPGPSEMQPEVPIDDRTLVEFTLSATEDGGTRLRVLESGFAALRNPAAARYTAHEEGWEEELAELVTYLHQG